MRAKLYNAIVPKNQELVIISCASNFDIWYDIFLI